MSQAIAAISDAAVGPSITWVLPSIEIKTLRSPVVPTTGTENRLA